MQMTAHLQSLRYGVLALLVGGMGSAQVLPSTPASPGGVSISPPVLTIDSATNNSTTVLVTNTSLQPIILEAELQRWIQDDGKNVFSPTRDVVVNPARFTLNAGATQIVRVGFRSAPATQQAYRLFLRQNAAASAENGIRVVLQFSLPLILQRPGDVARMRTERSCNGDQRILTLLNEGTGRQTYSEVTAEVMGQQLPLPSRTVLAGGKQQYQFPAPSTWSGEVTLNYLDQLKTPRHETFTFPAC